MSILMELKAADKSNYHGEIDRTVQFTATGFSLISVICSIYLIYITSTKYAKTITVKLIRMIAVYTMLEQLLYAIFEVGLLNGTGKLYDYTNLAFRSFHSLAFFWSFTISFLSYKIITSGGTYSINKFYATCQIISFVALAYYVVMGIYVTSQLKSEKFPPYIYILSYVPPLLLMPIISIILYIMQMIYAKRFGIVLSQYQINIKRLIWYPIFEAILFLPTILTVVDSLLGLHTLPFPELLQILEGCSGIGQLIVFFFVRNIATQENLVEIQPVNANTIEFDNISKEIDVDRDLARALVDE